MPRTGLLAACIGVMALVSGASGHASTICFDQAGQWQREPVAGGSLSCHELALPPGVTVEWAKMTDKPLADAPRLMVSGAAGGVPPSLIAVPTREPVISGSMPFERPLLARLTAKPFGTEHRAVITRGDTLTLECRPGVTPAGAVLQAAEAHWPRDANASVRLTLAADSGFQVGLASAADEPRTLHRIEGSPDARTIDIPLPGARGPSAPALNTLVLVCPAEGGVATLSDVRLQSRAFSMQGHRAGWAWNEARWRSEPEALLRAARRHGIKSLYISVSVQDDRLAAPKSLARFVSLAAESGIKVWVVEGDPAMVLDAGRDQAIRRLRAIQQYQSSASERERLAGVQYDIEPYLLPGYATDPSRVAQQWRVALQALDEVAGRLPMDVVVPFWLRTSPGGEEVLSSVRGSNRSLTVMAYRTDPDDIQVAAEPLLAWGVANSLPVRVALEAGPLGDELTQYYALDERGDQSTLWKVPTRQGDLMVRLASPARLERGQGYRMLREQVAPASRVSFLGDIPKLYAAVGIVDHIFPAWESYAGLSLHGLLD